MWGIIEYVVFDIVIVDEVEKSYGRVEIGWWINIFLEKLFKGIDLYICGGDCENCFKYVSFIKCEIDFFIYNLFW